MQVELLDIHNNGHTPLQTILVLSLYLFGVGFLTWKSLLLMLTLFNFTGIPHSFQKIMGNSWENMKSSRFNKFQKS